ncbi:MAG: PfkB family carbohydrate kinase [Fibrobacterales bacterium]
MIGCFGEIVVDCFPDKQVVGGAPLNVAVHLKRLGVDVELISEIGMDHYGSLAGQLLNGLSLDSKVGVSPDKKTGVATITMGEEGHSFSIDRGSAWEHIETDGAGVYVILVFGTLAMISEDNRKSFDQLRGKSRMTRTFCDLNLRAPLYTKETIEWSLERANYLKMSDEEALTLGKLFDQGSDIPTILEWLKSEWDLIEVYCTLGAEGSISILEDGLFECAFVPHSDMVVVDTVGAGDAFSAALLYAMYFGTERRKVIPRAHSFAASICTLPGAIPQDTSPYSALVDQNPLNL